MSSNILKILTLFLCCLVTEGYSYEIWVENFSTPEKGIWGDENDTIVHSDFLEIKWSLQYSNLSLSDVNDYAKTVTTSGGRFEVKDIDGEVTWRSEWINISEYKNVQARLTAYETGSGANIETKYLKAYYKIDLEDEILFTLNGINEGNWGSNTVEQKNLLGDSIQIVVYMANHYTSDKVTLDEVVIEGESKIEIPPVNPYDIVINEIMADPNPPVNLPEEEYLELFNRSENPIGLSNWILKVRDTEKKLDKLTLQPGEYLILCTTGALEQFSSYGKSMSVPGFPSLINKGATIVLKNEKDVVIDSIAYSDNWYGDDEKNNGGWSLERIDPNRFCGQQANWKASVAENGGTPGIENSIKASNIDIEPPYVLWATATSSNTIEVMFSEAVKSEVINNTSSYNVSDGIGLPNQIVINPNEAIVLSFSSQFMGDKKYNLELNNFEDECGNMLLNKSFEIQWMDIKPGDIVINEVLFNPYSGGADFVELVNISEKAIPLYRLSLATRDEDMELKQLYTISESKGEWVSGEYLLCTKDIEGITAFYFTECPECFLEMNKFPTYSDAEGYVVLLADSTKVIDEFRYSEKMHSEVLYDEEGVSLERVRFDVETNKSSSWHSASEQVGYATPGYLNSQTIESGMTNEIVIEPESFSPNNDGYNDLMLINYRMEKPGNIANAWIFDSGGRLVYQLVVNEVLGTRGSIEWNGEDETGHRLSLGAYIVMVEVFNMDGQVMRFKDACILTDILE